MQQALPAGWKQQTQLAIGAKAVDYSGNAAFFRKGTRIGKTGLKYSCLKSFKRQTAFQ